jgi:hypothetical protein
LWLLRQAVQVNCLWKWVISLLCFTHHLVLQIDHPHEIMSWRYEIFSKFSETLPMTHLQMDVMFRMLEPFNSILTQLLTWCWLKCGNTFTSIQGRYRVLEICNLLYVTLAVNTREWPCHDSFWCYISAVRILSWGEPVKALHQCHFARRAGGVNEEAQGSLLHEFMGSE